MLDNILVKARMVIMKQLTKELLEEFTIEELFDLIDLLEKQTAIKKSNDMYNQLLNCNEFACPKFGSKIMDTTKLIYKFIYVKIVVDNLLPQVMD